MPNLGVVVVHAMFHCTECDKEWGDYLTARQEAQEHTRRTGHTTRGEVGSAYEYTRKP